MRKVSKHFGGLAALSDVDLEVYAGEIVGLIGPNGAGKTTLFNVVTGTYRPTEGTVVFQGEDITGLKPSAIAAKGLVRTFQATSVFKNLTVLDNVIVSCHLRAKAGFWAALTNSRSNRRDEDNFSCNAMDIIKYLHLDNVKDQQAKNLPHGYQRVLGISMALAANPQLLLLDEPATGLNPQESTDMIRLIKEIRDRGITILLVEHDMSVVMSCCARIVVLNFGEKIAEGSPEEIQSNEKVIETYLGERKRVT